MRSMIVQDLDLGGRQPVSHEFRRGCINVVLGRNRSGKTRLARVLSGLETSAPGTVVCSDGDVSGADARERRVALVYQAFVNYPNLTVAENIASPMRAQGLSNSEREQRVQDLSARLRIADLLQRFPHELSGGQQQRVAIARALAQDAGVLVMDEPLVNLDYKLREELEMELRALLADTDLTVIYNTSDPRDAFKLGDEVVLMAEHEIIQSGTPLEVYRNPHSLTAASLMSDPGVNVWSEEQSLRAVRPEHLTLDSERIGDIRFEVVLTGLETNGSETFVHCSYQDNEWVARLGGMRHFEMDSTLALAAASGDVLQFARMDAAREHA
ncbi:MAG: ABC transporter ATP-binding protein [Pseudomonadales bacterium]|nr:ABC transporter ATP-binding protein [Pseudomonadales bacterium]MDP6471483.1 ABC transporter ATP-binding protein [Pseudomonadales bacterium]MDP6972371.1 ABC transporter ATP-binding protein [Pseudomonadales bacterium]